MAPQSKIFQLWFVSLPHQSHSIFMPLSDYHYGIRSPHSHCFLGSIHPRIRPSFGARIVSNCYPLINLRHLQSFSPTCLWIFYYLEFNSFNSDSTPRDDCFSVTKPYHFWSSETMKNLRFEVWKIQESFRCLKKLFQSCFLLTPFHLDCSSCYGS